MDGSRRSQPAVGGPVRARGPGAGGPSSKRVGTERVHADVSTKSHIVLIVADYTPALGGTTTQTRMHACEFARRGWEVTILTRRITWGEGHDTVDGLPVRRLGPLGRGRMAKLPLLVAMWWWLLRHRASIQAVSVVMEPDFAVCSVFAGLGSSTILTWVTDGDATRTLRGARGAFRRRVLRRHPHVALTARMETELRSFGLSDVHVIPVPVDIDRFRPPNRDERAAARLLLGAGTGPVVAFVGHLQARKGVDRLLVALRRLVDFGMDPSLVVVGGVVEAADSQYRDELHRYVEQEGLSQRVRFVGPQTDVVPYLHGADVFCLPSNREGMPNVLLEAMACGLPCLAPRDAGGDALLDDGAGFVTMSNEPEILAAALRDLLREPSARRTIATTALARVRSAHGITPIVDAYEGILDRSPDRRPLVVAHGRAEPLVTATVHA